MAKGNFERCHAVTAVYEGGWSDHKADPGGKTMYGVTERVFHAWLRGQGKPIRPVRSITLDEAKALYKAEYWYAAKCEGLAAGVDLAVYDPAVNSGVSRARKWLEASIGGQDVQTIKRICAARLSFVRSLATWKHFGKGWARRIAGIEAKAVAMSLGAGGASAPQVKDRLKIEAGIAGEAARTDAISAKAGAGGAAASSSTSAVETVSPMAGDWLFYGGIGVAVLAVLFALWMTHRSRGNAERAEAYTGEANGTA